MESKKNLSIEELFRQQLENAELIPGAEVSNTLMKKLARKEFMRFNPARFNIYYAGLIAAAAITAGVLLFSGSSTDRSEPSTTIAPGQIEMPVAVQPSANKIPVKKPGRTISAKISDNNQVIVKSVTSEKTDSPVNSSGDQIKATEVKPVIDAVLPGSHEPGQLHEPSGNSGAMFVPSAFSGCAPLKVAFDNQSDSYDRFSWNFGDGGSSDKPEPVWVFDSEGEYRVVMEATGKNGSKSSYSALITVFPKPKASFETRPANAVIPDDEVTFLNNSAGAMTYSWDFGDGSTSTTFEPRHKYSRFSKYNVSLTAVSENGCSDSFIINDAFSGTGFFIKMPNAFIPNPQGPSGGYYNSKSDESAEIFHPVYSGVSEYHLQIFSKIGILLFESNDVNIGWDGYFKGQLCNPGVYVWKTSGYFINGESFVKRGDVTLLKN